MVRQRDRQSAACWELLSTDTVEQENGEMITKVREKGKTDKVRGADLETDCHRKGGGGAVVLHVWHGCAEVKAPRE